MDVTEDDTDGGDLELLRALAFTPEVAPFQGTETYAVRACLGEGGFGVVYEVEDQRTKRRLALKTLKPQRSGFAANIRRLKREFRSVADLVHPNLVAVHELSSHAQRWFFTMELVRGCDFRQYVRPGGQLDEGRLRSALSQLVAGVAVLHEAGVVHRDLKPSNVLVEPDGHVVILDFGLAGDDIDPGLYAAGTPTFMSPEQVAGAAVTAASDWYSVGVMLHEALTGELPGGAGVLGAHLPADLRRACAALLRFAPAERPTAPELRAMLGERTDGTDVRLAVARFVGRADELATLHAAYAEIRDGSSRVMRIAGPSGVGKSALVARFASALPEEALVLAGKCYEREAVPFKAFDGIVDALVAYLKARSPGELAAVLPPDVALAAQLFPSLGELDAIRVHPRAPGPADPTELRERGFHALKQLLGSLAASRPVVMAVDDLQWGDLDSARLLLSLLAAPRPRLLVLLAYRSEDAAGGTLGEALRLLDTAGTAGELLAIEPLPQADARELAELLVGAGTEVAQTIAARGEGHPMFMAELAHGLARRELGDEVPSLVDMLWRRLDRLAPEARALIETVAVAGAPLPQDLCFAAAGLDGAAAIVRQLRADRLLRARDGELDVFHDRIRDAATAFISEDARVRRHLALAQVLERADGDLETIARHFDAAGEREPAGRYALRAGDAAMRALAFDRAAALFQMAIDHGHATADTYQRLGDAWRAAGASAAGGHAYLEAARRCDGARAIDLASLAGGELCCAGDFATGEAALAMALRAVGERAPGTRIKLTVLEGMYHLVRMRMARFRAGAPRRPADRLRLDVLDRAAYGFGYGGVPRALGLMMRSGRRALESGDPRHVGRGLVMGAFGLMAGNVRRLPLIDATLDRACAIATELDDPELAALATRIRGESHFMFYNMVEAQRLCAQAALLIRDRCRGMAIHRRYASFVDARSALQLGDVRRCREVLDWLLPEALDRHDPVCADGLRLGVLPLLELVHDRPSAARNQLALASADDRCGNLALRAEAESIVAMYCGDAREAVAGWRRHVPDLRREGLLQVAGFRVMAARAFATALSAVANDRELAEVRRLVRPLRRLQFPAAAAACAAVDANLAIRAGDRDRARELLDLAGASYAAEGSRLDAGAARYARAWLAGDDLGPVTVELHALGLVAPRSWTAAWYPTLALQSPRP